MTSGGSNFNDFSFRAKEENILATRKIFPLPKTVAPWNICTKTASGNGISRATCKSAPRSRQITKPASHHSVFYRLDALPAAQPTASKHGVVQLSKTENTATDTWGANLPTGRSSSWMPCFGRLPLQAAWDTFTHNHTALHRSMRGRWKRKYWKTQVRNSAFRKDGKRMYGKRKYNANLQSDKKSLVLHKLVWCIFKWGGQVDYRLFFSEMT